MMQSKGRCGRRIVGALVVALSAALGSAPSVAYACGGCFSPVLPPAPGAPKNPQAVLQDAERVVFLRDEASKTSTVWVEVRYSGLAQDFGWVLPLPKQPVVGVGTTAGLDRLDTATSVRFEVIERGLENCRDPYDGCEPVQWGDVGGSFGDASAALDAGSTGGDGGGPKGVKILDQGQTGPYDYAVIQGSDAKALQSWLDTRGYKTPAAATPIIQSHADKGDVFVAIKLSNGEGVNAIRPLVLQMPDAEPCVPLRLTSIAAANEMNVVVTLGGTGRAIAKNMLHVDLNLAKLNWASGANNYVQVLAAAIDEAAGRAFFTESAQAASAVQGEMYPTAKLTTSWAAGATNLHEFAVGLYNIDPSGTSSPWLHADVASAVAKAGIVEPIFKTFGIKDAPAALGQLWVCGAIWSGGVFTPTGNETCIPAGENFFNPSKTYTATDAKAVPVDGKALATALDKEVGKPLLELQSLLAKSKTVTRLALRISPEEMDRDPIFAFNADLPMVERTRSVERWGVCSSGWLPVTHQRFAIPGAGSFLFATGVASTAADPRFVGAPFARSVEVIDEAGAAVAVAKAQVALVDTAIAGAVPGTPSPAGKLALDKPAPWALPQSDPQVTKLDVWKMPGGCVPKSGWKDGALPPGGAGVADAGSSDTGASSGDAGGGFETTGDGSAGSDSNGGGGSKTPRKSSGCSASSTHGGDFGALALALLAALALSWRRRHGAAAR